MKVTPTAIADVLIIEPKVFGDECGFFYESFNQKAFAETTGVCASFVQDNHSRSAKGVLRCLHYQVQRPQRRLVRGAVIDIRNGVHFRPVGRERAKRTQSHAGVDPGGLCTWLRRNE